MGINPRKVYASAMGIAAVTAATSGVLVGMTFTFYPYSGTQYLIIAFGVVIVGGLGSLPGTFIGGMILGVSQLVGARILGTGFQLFSGYIRESWEGGSLACDGQPDTVYGDYCRSWGPRHPSHLGFPLCDKCGVAHLSLHHIGVHVESTGGLLGNDIFRPADVYRFGGIFVGSPLLVL